MKMNSKEGGSQDNLLEHEAPMDTNSGGGGNGDHQESIHTVEGLGAQTKEEKRFLLLVERGDVASIKRQAYLKFTLKTFS
jgi:hypothetical protein